MQYTTDDTGAVLQKGEHSKPIMQSNGLTSREVLATQRCVVVTAVRA
jgi:hypothetical protein